MSLTRNNFKIAELINKQLLEEISENEKSILAEWRNNPANEKLFYQIKSELISGKHYKAFKEIDVEKGWQKNKMLLKQGFFRIGLRKTMRVAATITLFLAIAGSIYLVFQEKGTNEIVAQTIIPPGESKAELWLADGSVVDLNDKPHQITETGAKIKVINGRIDYTENKEIAAEHALHILNVPRGGEYQLILPDGTKVWLNSKTQLEYPISFDENQRKVLLTGEASFEVKHDAQKPFIVTTADGVEIKVLGTKFNIMAYKDVENIEITLVEGAVKVTTRDNDAIILNPGEQAKISRETLNTTVLNVDTNLHTAWTKGRFVFDKEELESILLKLSRWYNVDIEYLNESVKKKRLSADLRRYDEINSFLEFFSKVSMLDFEIVKRTIKVKERTKQEKLL